MLDCFGLTDVWFRNHILGTWEEMAPSGRGWSSSSTLSLKTNIPSQDQFHSLRLAPLVGKTQMPAANGLQNSMFTLSQRQDCFQKIKSSQTSLAIFSLFSQQSNFRQSHLLIPEQTSILWAVLSNMIMTHWYGHLESQMNRCPKFGLDTKADEAVHTPRGYKKFDNLHNSGLSGEQGRPLKQV